jgi:hypothetical protein
MGGIFSAVRHSKKSTLFELHILTTFHFDWHCSGVTDNSGFKVMYDGGKISCDCMEPFLSGFLYAIKNCGSRGKFFSPCVLVTSF